MKKNKFLVWVAVIVALLFWVSTGTSKAQKLCSGYINCCYYQTVCCDPAWQWNYPDCGGTGQCVSSDPANCQGCTPYSRCDTGDPVNVCVGWNGYRCGELQPPGPGPGCYVSNNLCSTPPPGCVYNCGNGVCCSTDGETVDNCPVDCDPGGGGGDPDTFTVSGFVGFDANKVEDTYQSDCGAYYNLSPAADLRIAWINNSVGGDSGEINYHTDCGPSYYQVYQNDGEYNFTLNNLPAGYNVYAIDHNVAAGCTLSGNTAVCGQLSDNNDYIINFIIQSDTPPPTPLPCPTGFNVSCAPSGTQVTISWNALVGAASYFLRLNRFPYTDWFNPDGGDLALESVDPSQTHNITAGSEYMYDVQGRKPGEPWPYSGLRCPFATFTCVEPSSCQISLSSNPTSINIGGTSSISLQITEEVNGTIDRVDYSSGAQVSLNPNSDISPPFPGTVATGESAGQNINITALATMVDEGATCNAFTTLTVASSPWWQVKDADVSTNGSLISLVPPSTTEGYYFNLRGTGGYPGIPAYGTTNLDGENVSEEGWLAQSGYNASKRYDYNYFHSAIPSDVTPKVIEANPMPNNYFAANYNNEGNVDSQEYHWYEYDGGSGESLTINSEGLANRKVILLVNSNVSLKGI